MGGQHYSEVMQRRKWKGPCLTGRTKESATKVLQKFKMGKTMTSEIVNVLSPREKHFAQSTFPINYAKGAGQEQEGQESTILSGYMDT